MVKIPNFFLAFGIMSLLKSGEAQKLIKENTEKLDSLIDAEFPKKSEEIQKAIVEKVLLAISRELMKERPNDYYSLIDCEARRLRAEMAKGSVFL